ncbi:pilus assembly protein TadG-related protein [Stenotrophomonas sp. HITSZ_GD]|uniref:pilus assembly protein TadG-related protein n=1 Tax=Stenotrophomonas sp. HITSZ_GD TaxID=3037248 RepID=UPI00240D7797|nr:pilus assembly protein TadG-related protein [Stenotrophomonas sp. HITSZ_GD]MDG2524434.1 pilus assembly protein TadG-related protein [Stenotrophomonas sp. HITSZ_GD]
MRAGRFTAPTQRGASALTLMLLMIALSAMLGLVEIGYLYWSKRDLQKIADLAALAGAQQLETCNAAGTDNAAARGNAFKDNAFDGTFQARCGFWNLQAPDAPLVAADAGHPLNAVQVELRRGALPMFGRVESMPQVRASAVARRAAPVVAFSAGAKLLNVDGAAPLQQLLKTVGVDLSSTEVASYRGLAQLKLTPRGLLQALGIPVSSDLTLGQLNGLLTRSQISVGQLLQVMTSLANQQQLAGVDLSLLQQRLAAANLDSAQLQLGSDDANAGLFASLVAPDGDANSALDVELNALDVLGSAISVGNGRHAVQVQQLNLLGAVTAQASIVEPASIGIGPVGTTAYNAQVRVRLDIDTDQLALLGPLVKLLGIRLHLPVYIDAVDGYARLKDVDCASTPQRANFDVLSSVSNICVGKPSGDWRSTRELCSAANLGNEQLVKLFGLNVLTDRIVLPVLPAQDTLWVPEGGTGSVAPNPLQVGTLLSQLTDALFNALGKLFQTSGSNDDTASSLATQYLEATRKSSGAYDPQAVIGALRNGTGGLGALGDWQTKIVKCDSVLGLVCTTQQGSVWDGFLGTTQIKGGLVGGLLDALGLTSCGGLVAGLAYNTCVRDNLAKYLQTRPGGLGDTSYNPQTGTGSCNTVLCALLKPVMDATLRPLLNGVGTLLGTTLDQVLGLQLGRTDVRVDDIQCHAAQLVR